MRGTVGGYLTLIVSMAFLLAVGAIAGAIVGLFGLLAAVAMASPEWLAGREDTLLAVALGVGGLCGAALALALIVTIAFRNASEERHP
jgi:hypothetical protein